MIPKLIYFLMLATASKTYISIYLFLVALVYIGVFLSIFILF